MSWYFLISRGGRMDGYGVKVYPNAFACWTVSEKGIVLSLDVRAGCNPVRSRNRRIELCTLVSRMGKPGESAFAAWGFELVKIDFITFDWCRAWGSRMENSPCGKKTLAWKDDSRIGAEVVKGLYQAMREAAGDMYIIGCNALDHFAAGLLELQRAGGDTDGRGWSRTRKMGPNTIDMRTIHNRTFYLGDGDCVGLAHAGAVPLEKNRQWLDLVAKSGTSLFVSWKSELAADPEVADALSRALKTASRARGTGEPLDWMETERPVRWAFDGFGETSYDWD